ncbi:MAG: hybrid sensor histidine kinase/response regulator [Planctomycetota bacterium]|nr:MAG: hybrid sensor histidine kinase/response regulator [Planctomycetota bacterium]
MCPDDATHGKGYPPFDAQETNLRKMIDAIPVPLAVLDEKRNILIANPGMARLVSRNSAKEIHGLGFCGLMDCRTGPSPDCSRTECTFEHGMQAISSGMVSQFEDTWTPGEGETNRSYELTISAFPLMRNAEVIVAVSDLSPEHHLEKNLLEVSRLASLGELVSGVAHELNNALSGVLGFGQLIAAQVGEEAIRDDILRLHREARRTQDIVANLLQVSRRSSPIPKPLDLNAAINSVIHVKSYQLRVENIEVCLDLSPDIPAVFGRASELQQVVLNLINNAVDSIRTASGSGVISVRTSYSSSEKSVRMEVADTGPGVPHEMQKRIFESFFTTKDPGKGTGLGLHICQSIIKAHGGRISVSDNPGGGAVFTIDVPAEGGIKASGTESEIILRGLPTIEEAAVLIVDDEPVIRELVPRILKPLRCHVDVADSVDSALQLIKKNKYDLVIADIKMPNMGGMELMKFLSKHYPKLASRVCFITGDTVSAETRQYLGSVPNPTLRKPFKNKELQTLVLRMLGVIG